MKKTQREPRYENLVNVWDRTYQQILARGSQTEPVLPTGIPKLDEITWGFSRKMNTIVAKSSEGKSSFALGRALHLADRGKRVLFCTNEDDNEDVVEKAFCMLTRSDNQQVKRGLISTEKSQYMRTVLGGLEIYCMDSYGYNWPEFFSLIEDAKASQNPPDIIFYDYLQNIEVTESSRYESAKMFMGQAYIWTNRNKIPIVMCSQVRLEKEILRRRPRISDSEGGGFITQNTYLGIVLHHPAKWGLPSSDYNESKRTGFKECPEDYYELHVDKQKTGPLGWIALRFHGPTYTFSEWPEMDANRMVTRKDWGNG